MGFLFNPFTGNLDWTGSGGGSSFDEDKILCDNFFATLFDQNGNILLDE